MPLIYQGRLKRRTIGHPKTALRFGEKTLGPVTSSRRLDARLAWERPEMLEACADLLPSDSNAYWMDVAAHVDVDSLPQIAQWASTLRCGHISLICLKEAQPAEVRISLPGPGPERYDDERHERRFGHNPAVFTIKSMYLRAPIGVSKEQKRLAAARVRGCFQSVSQFSLGDQPDYEDWLRAQLDTAGMTTSAANVEASQIAPLFFGTLDEPGDILWKDVDLGTSFTEECPVDFTVCLPPESGALARTLWTKFAGLLPQIDIVIIRCVDQRQVLLDVLDRLDLFSYHPHRNNHLFGISTLHSQNPIEAEAITNLVNDDSVTHRLADWDVRWSDLKFDLSGVPREELGSMGSHYVIRSDSARSTDRLFLNIGLEDPNEPTFRGARRQLAAAFGDDISRESAWEFAGSPIDAPLGRRYQQLNDALSQALSSVMLTPVQLPRAPTTSVLEFVPFLRGQSTFEDQFLDHLRETIAEALPGFQFDRRAHVTDRYFVEFVRRIPGGYQLMEIQRTRQPLGWTARFGVCLFRIPFDDLVPGVGCAVPGSLVDMKALLPERDVHWTCRSHRGLQQQLTDFGTILELRARPFFDAAQQILQEFSVPERKVDP